MIRRDVLRFVLRIALALGIVTLCGHQSPRPAAAETMKLKYNWDIGKAELPSGLIGYRDAHITLKTNGFFGVGQPTKIVNGGFSPGKASHPDNDISVIKVDWEAQNKLSGATHIGFEVEAHTISFAPLEIKIVEAKLTNLHTTVLGTDYNVPSINLPLPSVTNPNTPPPQKAMLELRLNDVDCDILEMRLYKSGVEPDLEKLNKNDLPTLPLQPLLTVPLIAPDFELHPGPGGGASWTLPPEFQQGDWLVGSFRQTWTDPEVDAAFGGAAVSLEAETYFAMQVVPEPTSAWLFGIGGGVIGAALWRSRRRMRAGRCGDVHDGVRGAMRRVAAVLAAILVVALSAPAPASADFVRALYNWDVGEFISGGKVLNVTYKDAHVKLKTTGYFDDEGPEMVIVDGAFEDSKQTRVNYNTATVDWSSTKAITGKTHIGVDLEAFTFTNKIEFRIVEAKLTDITGTEGKTTYSLPSIDLPKVSPILVDGPLLQFELPLEGAFAPLTPSIIDLQLFKSVTPPELPQLNGIDFPLLPLEPIIPLEPILPKFDVTPGKEGGAKWTLPPTLAPGDWFLGTFKTVWTDVAVDTAIGIPVTMQTETWFALQIVPESSTFALLAIGGAALVVSLWGSRRARSGPWGDASNG